MTLVGDAAAGPLKKALGGDILAAVNSGKISLYLTPIAPGITALATIAGTDLISVDGETTGSAMLEIRFNHTFDR